MQYVIALQKAARKAIVQTIFTRIAIAAPVLGKQHKHHIAPNSQNASPLNTLFLQQLLVFTTP